jgi:hypothetical protein
VCGCLVAAASLSATAAVVGLMVIIFWRPLWIPRARCEQLSQIPSDDSESTLGSKAVLARAAVLQRIALAYVRGVQSACGNADGSAVAAAGAGAAAGEAQTLPK